MDSCPRFGGRLHPVTDFCSDFVWIRAVQGISNTSKLGMMRPIHPKKIEGNLQCATRPCCWCHEITSMVRIPQAAGTVRTCGDILVSISLLAPEASTDIGGPSSTRLVQHSTNPEAHICPYGSHLPSITGPQWPPWYSADSKHSHTSPYQRPS